MPDQPADDVYITVHGNLSVTVYHYTHGRLVGVDKTSTGFKPQYDGQDRYIGSSPVTPLPADADDRTIPITIDSHSMSERSGLQAGGSFSSTIAAPIITPQ